MIVLLPPQPSVGLCPDMVGWVQRGLQRSSPARGSQAAAGSPEDQLCSPRQHAHSAQLLLAGCAGRGAAHEVQERRWSSITRQSMCHTIMLAVDKWNPSPESHAHFFFLLIPSVCVFRGWDKCQSCPGRSGAGWGGFWWWRFRMRELLGSRQHHGLLCCDRCRAAHPNGLCACEGIFQVWHISVIALKTEVWFSWRFRLCLSKWCHTSVWVACGPKETRRKTCLPPFVPPLHSSTLSQTRS